MSISSSFLWRFLDDVWDLLPTEDRDLFQAYWKAQIQIGAGLEHRVIELSQSTLVSEVPVFSTERWNRFLMNEDFCDLFQQTDSIVLTMTAPSALSRETAFYDTVVVSSASGQIFHEETIRFFDNAVHSLRYGKIINGTISLTLGTTEYTPGRDYVVNLFDGSIQALDTGRIPPTEILTVRYQHSEYTLDLDYVVDSGSGSIARTVNTTIPDGGTVAVTYTYNATATVGLDGTEGQVAISTLTDPTKNFSGLAPNRTLTITSGPNVGTYTVSGILSPTSIQVAELFPQAQDSDVNYSINAFPHGIRVDSRIVSIPVLQDLIDDPTSVLLENVDYRVSGGILSVRSAFLKSTIGPEEKRERQAWAEVTKVNLETPYRNFGVLIDFFRENSEEYKLALQGLWYTFWTGSTPNNLQRGMHILLGLPFAKRAGRVTRVDVEAAEIGIVDPRGQVITYTIPADLDPTVAVGDEVDRFESLTTGVQIIDRNNEPGFVANRLGRAGISKFLTSNATVGSGNSDETKALELLEHHLFLPQILVEAITKAVNVQELVTFLDNMKPQWTDYVFSFSVEEEEEVQFSEEMPPLDLNIDLTTTVSNNQWNQSFQFNSFLVQRTTGEMIAGGTQATGNFRDASVNWVTLGVDKYDTVRITSGIFQGYHQVLKRVSASVLSLDIPDGMIVGAFNIDYVVIPSERLPDNDSVHLRRENILLPGTVYSAPAVLNTKSNANIAATSLTVDDVKALLLVDIANVGAEVQEITNADLTAYEITVAVPPAPGVQDHEICSCALKRTNNIGPVVTDAFAI
jgi:hypothetical protein